MVGWEIFVCLFFSLSSFGLLIGSSGMSHCRYNAMQCPMETLNGRRSSTHNMIAGGVLGYLGVASGKLGVPFMLQ